MTNLSILNYPIRTSNNLYCLNDLHKASGDNKKHQPAFFMRSDQTKELITEITRSTDLQIAIETKRGGRNQGTWVCKELVYSYAMWISPKFHLQVIRAFDGMNTPKPKRLLSPIEKINFQRQRWLVVVESGEVTYKIPFDENEIMFNKKQMRQSLCDPDLFSIHELAEMATIINHHIQKYIR